MNRKAIRHLPLLLILVPLWAALAAPALGAHPLDEVGMAALDRAHRLETLKVTGPLREAIVVGFVDGDAEAGYTRFLALGEAGNPVAQFWAAMLVLNHNVKTDIPAEMVPGVLPEVRRSLEAMPEADPMRNFCLGLMAMHGLGGMRSPIVGLEHIRRAAEVGHLPAMHSLGVAYEGGIGTTPALEEALDWYRRAAEAGLPVSQMRLGQLLLAGATPEGRDIERGLHWFRRAAEQEFPPAQIFLARQYASGEFLPADEAKALGWYVRAGRRAIKEGRSKHLVPAISGIEALAPDHEALPELRAALIDMSS